MNSCQTPLVCMSRIHSAEGAQQTVESWGELDAEEQSELIRFKKSADWILEKIQENSGTICFFFKSGSWETILKGFAMFTTLQYASEHDS